MEQKVLQGCMFFYSCASCACSIFSNINVHNCGRQEHNNTLIDTLYYTINYCHKELLNALFSFERSELENNSIFLWWNFDLFYLPIWKIKCRSNSSKVVRSVLENVDPMRPAKWWFGASRKMSIQCVLPNGGPERPGKCRSNASCQMVVRSVPENVDAMRLAERLSRVSRKMSTWKRKAMWEKIRKSKRYQIGQWISGNSE